MVQKPIVLCILDGWGYNPKKENNAIEMGNTPVWHELVEKWPHAMLKTSGNDVGLPDGQMGNSEVGHMNLGAGRIVYQELMRIDNAIAQHELEKNPALLNLIEKLKETKGTCHVMGLMGPGGVHAMQTHMLATVQILNDNGIKTKVDVNYEYIDPFDLKYNYIIFPKIIQHLHHIFLFQVKN